MSFRFELSFFRYSKSFFFYFLLLLSRSDNYWRLDWRYALKWTSPIDPTFVRITNSWYLIDSTFFPLRTRKISLTIINHGLRGRIMCVPTLEIVSYYCQTMALVPTLSRQTQRDLQRRLLRPSIYQSTVSFISATFRLV